MYTYFGFNGDPVDTFTVAASDDGITWKYQVGSWAGQIDAPQAFKYEGSVYFHVGTANDQNFNLVPWLIGKANTSGVVSTIATIDWTSSGFHICDSGEWFQEANGTVHLFVPCSLTSTPSEVYAIYETHAVTAGGATCLSGCDFLHWSAPAAISVNETNVYDPKVWLIGSTYYMWLSNHTTRTIDLASSSSLLGPYTIQRSGDWAGWGTFLEGPTMYSTGPTSWRLAVEKYDSSHQMFYSDCSTLDLLSCTWTALQPWHEDMLYRHGSIIKNF